MFPTTPSSKSAQQHLQDYTKLRNGVRKPSAQSNA